MQLSFKLPEIDRNGTRAAVESILEKYQIYLLMDPEEFEPKITSSFKLVSTAPSNQFHSSTEKTAIKRVDTERKRRDFLKRIQRAVNRLAYQERSVIINRYMAGDDVYDYEVYNDLGFSERKYYRIKARAFYKLAFILRIEVYKNKDGEAV
ncbi:ArpU family phage packaging/lysis transcriptional regulator [Oceanobacillus alkalisoli]|uniref:ArpU family phage packaging/lysis transcriptional regulator n=1 Tax=Oceanobacillus alkalisoli TaxID=2925113 RepID=UPI001F1221FB|nr:ArpU family phage packaging/lysis transcriptional regulator [Oceanobacillus alkalisoli]MCF3941585.1 ArpU family transcriptional regulator [Oceanobacillus alkalisoli]